MRFALALAGALLCGNAIAHATGASYLDVAAPAAGPLEIRWDIPATDLGPALELDRDGDGRYDAGEIAFARPALARLAGRNLAVARGGTACVLSNATAALATREAAPFVSLRLQARCIGEGALELATALFFDSPGYSMLFEVHTPGGRYPGVLDPARPRWRQPDGPAWPGTFARFLAQGTWHVLIGYDHVAFLLLLLLPSVLTGLRSGW